jgi:hypothetical protein
VHGGGRGGGEIVGVGNEKGVRVGKVGLASVMT